MRNFYFYSKLKKLCKESKVDMYFNENSFISLHNLKNECNEKKYQFNIISENLNLKNANMLQVDISQHVNTWSIWFLSCCYNSKNISPKL